MVEEKFFVIDAHCHVYPEKIALKAVESTSRFYDGIDAAHDGQVSTLATVGKQAGIDHFVVQSVAMSPKQVNSINAFIAQTVADSNGTMTGLGTLHPDSTDIKGDIEHILELGLHGVKLHPDIQQFKIDDYRCLKIYELCEKYRLPILMHTGDYRYDFSNPNRVLPVMKIYTNLTMVGAHLGGWSVWNDAVEKLVDLPNFYVDCCSCMMYIDCERVEEIIRIYGADRVLFGTDYPLWSPVSEMKNFLSLGLSEDEKRLILSENAKKIYNICV